MRNFGRLPFWEPAASIVTMAPLISSIASNSGIATISLDFASSATWHSVTALSATPALAGRAHRRLGETCPRKDRRSAVPENVRSHLSCSGLRPGSGAPRSERPVHLCEVNDVVPAVAAADHLQARHDDDIAELVAPGPVDSRVL